MNKSKKINYKFIIFNFIFLFVVSYFVFHCFIGERGYIKMRYLKKEVLFKQEELAKLDGERRDLENKVNLIYDKSINKDYLDELARRYFGLIGEDEMCISDNNKTK